MNDHVLILIKVNQDKLKVSATDSESPNALSRSKVQGARSSTVAVLAPSIISHLFLILYFNFGHFFKSPSQSNIIGDVRHILPNVSSKFCYSLV